MHVRLKTTEADAPSLYVEVINPKVSLDSESGKDDRGRWWEFFFRPIFSKAVIFRLGTTV